MLHEVLQGTVTNSALALAPIGPSGAFSRPSAMVYSLRLDMPVTCAAM